MDHSEPIQSFTLVCGEKTVDLTKKLSDYDLPTPIHFICILGCSFLIVKAPKLKW